MVLPVMTGSASEETKYLSSITDESSIKEDLEVFGLTYSDYVITGENKERLDLFYTENGYAEQFIIFVAENYSTPFATYIYVYSPGLHGDLNVILDITISDSFSKTLHYNNTSKEMDLCKQDEEAGIYCFKIEELYKITDLVRKYSIDINDSGMDTFVCTYVTEFETGGNRVDYINYDSVIYILKDCVVPVIIETFTSWKYLFETNPFASQAPIRNEILSYLGITQSSYKPQIVYFYNFSTNKKVEQILSANMTWDSIRFTTMGYANNFTMEEILKYIYSGNLNRGDFANTEKVHVEITPEITQFPYNGKTIEIDAFQSPASNRLKELSTMEIDRLTEEEKSRFTDYDHSIMFSFGDYRVNYPGSNPCWVYSLVDNVRLTKLVYETDGKIYSSIVVDNDGPDTPTNPINPSGPLKKTWFEQFLLFLGTTTANIFGWSNIPEAGLMAIGVIDLILFIVVIFLLFKWIIIPIMKSL